jgi:hypothetical protein
MVDAEVLDLAPGSFDGVVCQIPRLISREALVTAQRSAAVASCGCAKPGCFATGNQVFLRLILVSEAGAGTRPVRILIRAAHARETPSLAASSSTSSYSSASIGMLNPCGKSGARPLSVDTPCIHCLVIVPGVETGLRRAAVAAAP